MFKVLERNDVSPEDAVVAAYNAIRILQYRHQLRPTGYLKFLRGHENTSSEARLNMALALIEEIEQRENAKIVDLEPRIAEEYVLALASAVNKRAEVELDPQRSKALIAQLEEETASAR